MINNEQYRGRLEPSAVLRAVCAGFEDGTEPAVCLNPAVEARGRNHIRIRGALTAMPAQVNECAQPDNGGCWYGGANLSACVDTFRDHHCACPAGTTGNGYTCDDIDECAIQARGHACFLRASY